MNIYVGLLNNIQKKLLNEKYPNQFIKVFKSFKQKNKDKVQYSGMEISNSDQTKNGKSQNNWLYKKFINGNLLNSNKNYSKSSKVKKCLM